MGYKIDEDGTIIREDYVPSDETEQDKLMAEYQKLDYEVNHLTRPTADPVKIARYAELKKLLNIEEVDILKFNKATGEGRVRVRKRPDNTKPKELLPFMITTKRNR